MIVSFDKNLFSGESYLLVDKSGYSWSPNVLKSDLHVSINGDCTLNSFFSLFEKPTLSFVEKKHLRSASEARVKNPQWKFMLTSRDYNSLKRKTQENIRVTKSFLESEKYCESYSLGNKILRELNGAYVDLDKIKNFISNEENPNLKSLLQGFIPKKNQPCHPPVYDRLKTVTGRLTVSSGPQFLLLPKKYKSILKSRYEDGIMVSIDFVSLEPRFARLSNQNSAPSDIYSDIKEVNNLSLDREIIKRAVLATLYGAGVNKVSELVGKEAFRLQKMIGEYFNFNKIIEHAGDYASTKIKNYFGRPIHLKKPNKNIAINNYVQSSSVEVALQGFSSLKFTNTMKPVAVIHDALILDILKSDLPDLKNIVNNGVEISGLGHFPLSLEVL